MPAPVIEVEGLGTLVSTLKKAGVDINELKDASQAAGNIVTSAAQARAPRLTGRLAGSIRPSRLAKGVRVSVGKASVPYAGAIHWGWPVRGITSQPFILDAARSTESQWTVSYLKDIQQALDRVRGI